MAQRLALVIGNAAYAHASELANPRNDASAIAGALKELDFKVALGTDLGRDQMEDILIRFGGDIRDADAALFFFAGHGLQVKGQNYLIPIDAEIKEELHLRRRTFSLTEILETMEQRARNTLMFLDACRDNPFTRSYLSNLSDEQRARSLVRSGLAGVTLEANRSSFIAFATSPDTVAFDGTDLHSPFTQGLLQHIRTPNISISDIMIEVRNSVLKATNGRQRPWDQSSMQERFFFNVADTEAKDEHPLSEESVLNVEALEHWHAIRDTVDPGELRAFLAEFGAAKVARLARDRLIKQEAAAWARLPTKRTTDALRAFLADYPDGANAHTATAELAAMLAEEDSAIPKTGRSETIAAEIPTAVPDPVPSTPIRWSELRARFGSWLIPAVIVLTVALLGVVVQLTRATNEGVKIQATSTTPPASATQKLPAASTQRKLYPSDCTDRVIQGLSKDQATTRVVQCGFEGLLR
jgi:uncharacterized caspase-like protein